jgi:multisubunit Na+/H+ antiporter MnhG subunit
MSELVADIIIYLLMLTGVGFGGIALMGLLIFPDIHSRMYTALRASLICVGAMVCSAVVYAITLLSANGGDLYVTFIFHVIFLAAVMAVGIMIINRQVLDKTRALVYCGTSPSKAGDQEEKGS